MPRSLWSIIAAFVLAIAAAGLVAIAFRLPFADQGLGESNAWHYLRTLLPIAAYALPPALAAIALSEARRVRGLIFWLFAGALIAVLGFIALTGWRSPSRLEFQTMRTFFGMVCMGLAAGWVYWANAGRRAGVLAADLQRVSDGSLDEAAGRRRCRWCAALGLLLGLIPLALLSWAVIHKPVPQLSAALTANAEADANGLLAKAGVPWAGLRIENHIGHVQGEAPDSATRVSAFATAQTVLKPLVGLPGVVAYLQNDLTGPQAPAAQVQVQAPSAQVPSPAAKAGADATAAALAANKAAGEAARRLAEDNAARKKADDAGRIAAAEEAASAKAAEVAASIKAAEEAASIKAADDTRRAAEAEAAAAATAKRIADDQKRLADELAIAQKADEEARIADERDAERAAVAAAHKAEADAKAKASAVPEAVPAAAVPAATTQCASSFSDMFRSQTIRFAIRSAKIDERYADYLDQLAELAKACDRYALTINGHSDRNGADGYNQALSDERAAVVKRALVARGVAADRLAASGFGAARPFDPSNNRAAYALNRRIDFAAAESPVPAAAADVGAPISLRSDPLPPEQCAPEFSRLFLSDAIRFAGNADAVTDEHADFIGQIASLLQRCERMTLMIDGHTDRKGSLALNQALSEARANAVRDALLDRDIPAQRLRARGFAGQRPFDPGSSPEALALNRRVEFGIAARTQTQP